ncbi:potassium:proton antiporter [Alteromonas sp. BL110]|uniref:potassium:proton antiporter n=1 Tax=Alteromonas sp. BL110 TaxID=1714845 RepID=UPI001E48B0B8|nr:potassium:proton antiporter [Alteromonas sp. BL110]
MTELMVACALSGILITAITTYSVQSHISLSTLQHATAIEEDARALQDTISRHLSRAGFIENVTMLTPFSTLANTNHTVSNVALGYRAGETLNSCITFSYDRDSSGAITESQDELFGYRLHDKSIEYRVGGKTCTQGGWFDLTDPNTVEVTQFAISNLHKGSWGSAYEINISLRSVINPNVVTSNTFVVEALNER